MDGPIAVWLSAWLSGSWPLPIDFVLVKRLWISWFLRLRFCGRSRNLEFTITISQSLERCKIPRGIEWVDNTRVQELRVSTAYSIRCNHTPYVHFCLFCTNQCTSDPLYWPCWALGLTVKLGKHHPSAVPTIEATEARGVQYVHWVMHKCIMVKVGGKRNTQKVCKKQVNFSKTEGGIFQSRGNNNFRKKGENVLKQGK